MRPGMVSGAGFWYAGSGSRSWGTNSFGGSFCSGPVTHVAWGEVVAVEGKTWPMALGCCVTPIRLYCWLGRLPSVAKEEVWHKLEDMINYWGQAIFIPSNSEQNIRLQASLRMRTFQVSSPAIKLKKGNFLIPFSCLSTCLNKACKKDLCCFLS